MTIRTAFIFLHKALLKLYPVNFQNAYAGEMNSVFIDLLGSNKADNNWQSLIVFWHECACLPACLIREYYSALEERTIKTLPQKIAINLIGFLSLFLLLGVEFGVQRSPITGEWRHPTLYLFLFLLINGIIFGVLGGGAIAYALSSENKPRIMLACGMGYLLGNFITRPSYWEVLGISTNWINGRWDSFFFYASEPIIGCSIGLSMGLVWRGWKAGIVFAIASCMIFTLGFWSNYLCWSILFNQRVLIQCRLCFLVCWVIGYSIFGVIAGTLWGVLLDKLSNWKSFFLNMV